MRILVSVWAVCFAMVSPLQAAEQFADRDLLASFAVSPVEKALKQMGHTPIVDRSVKPATLQITNKKHGAIIYLKPSCFPPESGLTGCPGLTIYTVSEPVPLEKINDFNNVSLVATAQSITDAEVGDRVILKRYLIADAGITYGSFLANLTAFEDSITNWLAINAEDP